MSTGTGQAGGANPGGAPPTGVLIKRVLTVIGLITAAAITFLGVVELTWFARVFALFCVAILWAAFETVLKKKVEKALSGFAELLNLRDLDEKTRNRIIRFGLGGFILLICAASVYKKAESLAVSYFATSTPTLQPVIGARSNYYMVVLDASEKMASSFDGRTKWDAAKYAAEKILGYLNPHSNYGLVLIGGKNPHESGSDACRMPSAPVIPLVDEEGYVFPPENLSISGVLTEISQQGPLGEGTFSEGFSLATNQLGDLPLDAVKMIIFIAGSSDSCAGEDDWTELETAISLVRNIEVYKEIIVLPEPDDPAAEEFVEKINQPDQSSEAPSTGGDLNTHAEAPNDFEELEQSIQDVVRRLEEYVRLRGRAQEAGAGTNPIPASSSRTGTPTKIGKSGSRVPELISVVPTLTCTSTSTATLTETSTPTASITNTVTPTIGATGTNTLIPYYPPTKPKKQSKDRESRRPRRLPDGCCKHCGSDSQPCGNSCISLSYTCSKPAGCACP